MNATFLPKPTDRHLDLITRLAPKIQGRIVSGAGRGLVIVTMDEAIEGYALGFTPAKALDVPHVMAQGVPEEAAIEIVGGTREYDDLESAAVLVVDRRSGGGTEYAYLLLDVRPTGGEGATRH